MLLLQKVNGYLRLTRQILSVYHKANSQLKPGVTLVTEDSIARRVEKRWAEAVQLANNRGSQMVRKKEQLMKLMDKLFNIFYCKCQIVTCDDSGCNEDCVSEAHIVCDCPRDQRLPAMELLFIKDQVDKVGRGKMCIASVDVKETTRLQKLSDRRKKIKDDLLKNKNAEISRKANEWGDSGDFSDDTQVDDDNNNKGDKDSDFVRNFKKKAGQIFST